MTDLYTKVCKINDDRLLKYVSRTRSGPEQIFYTGNDERDFERYKSDGGGRGHNVTMHDKPDTIRLTHPKGHYYALLVDGEWWWVNGCAPCNGGERGWRSYVECDEHNVCRRCSKHRSEFEGSVWGGSNGWICRPCYEIEHEEEKQDALNNLPDNWDSYSHYNEDSVLCPYCATKIEDSGDGELYGEEGEELKVDCHVCDNVFISITNHEITWTTKKIQADD